MNRQSRWLTLFALACMLLFVNCLSSDAIPEGTERIYYGIEIDGVLCGYAEFNVSSIEEDGKELVLIDEHIFHMLKALGMEFNADIKLVYHVDPETGQFTFHSSDVKQGDFQINSAVVVAGDTARLTSSMSDQTKVTPLPPGVILENTLVQAFLLDDFVTNNLDEKTYDVYDVREGEVQKNAYTRVGTDTLELAGRTYPALVLEEVNLSSGLKITWWIDPETGRVLKVIPISNRVVFLADRSIIKRIETADLDGIILKKTNVTIADIPAITYLKVRAKIEPVGLWVTPEGLSVPGQSFAGTVEENLIEGIFEVEHPRYDGSNAPAFPPPDYQGDESLLPYLESTEFIQADDPVLVEKAREITRGSADAWEAATRISTWVAESINYAIPGGGTARKTYDIRAGECGAHSFLTAAFCRAVGIPARVVWGCMYAPQQGGSFGQHGWNEIFMGDAGWITVDATMGENDFVDSGHIRIGVLNSTSVSFNPHEMEILDYRLANEAINDSSNGIDLSGFVGEYDGDKEILTLSAQEGRLALDIPNRMVLAFNEPDSAGRWYCTMSPRLFLTFDEGAGGAASVMCIHEIISMPRSADPETIDDDVPEEFRPYLGVYRFAALNADFTVLFRNGSLAVNNPLEKRVVGLKHPNEQDEWMDEFDKNVISFEKDESGAVTTMVIDAISRLPRR